MFVTKLKELFGIIRLTWEENIKRNNIQEEALFCLVWHGTRIILWLL